MNAYTRAGYHDYRAKGYPATQAIRNARVDDAFTDLENAGLVRVVWEPDCEPYQMGDAEDEEETREFIAREGVWGLVGQWRGSEADAWTTADSVWGIVGTDDDTYGPDIRESCLDALDAHRAEEAEALESRATYAQNGADHAGL